MDITLIIFWLASSLVFASLACVAGKRWGVAIPIAYLGALVPLSTVLVVKIVEVGPFTLPAAILAYPMIFFVTDVISELWGKRKARKAVWLGFYASVVTTVLVYFTAQWAAPPFAQENAEMFGELYALLPRALFAGFVAYLISQHLDVTIFHWLRRATSGRYLWLRNNGSTIVSQLVDSAIFITIAFTGVFPVIPMIFGQFAVKVGIALLDTPFIYAVVHFTKKIRSAEDVEYAEGVESTA